MSSAMSVRVAGQPNRPSQEQPQERKQRERQRAWTTRRQEQRQEGPDEHQQCWIEGAEDPHHASCC